jgi:hypothetical protein
MSSSRSSRISFTGKQPFLPGNCRLPRRKARQSRPPTASGRLKSRRPCSSASRCLHTTRTSGGRPRGWIPRRSPRRAPALRLPADLAAVRFIFLIVTRAVWLLGLSRREWWKDARILMLHHQLSVAERERPRAHSRLTWPDRVWLALLAGTVPAERRAAMRLIVTPGAAAPDPESGRAASPAARRRHQPESALGPAARPCRRRDPRVSPGGIDFGTHREPSAWEARPR